MDEKNDSLVITELTDFVIAGSAKTDEDGEGAQNERPNSPESDRNSVEDDEEDEILADDREQDYTQDTPDTWFAWPEYLRGLFDARIPRTGHRPYSKSWPRYVQLAKERSQ